MGASLTSSQILLPIPEFVRCSLVLGCDISGMTCHARLVVVLVLHLLIHDPLTATLANGLSQNPLSTFRKRPLLYPFEYDGHQDWELVPYDASVGVVTWIMGLKDRLTVSRQHPLGHDLMVCCLRSVSMCQALYLLGDGARLLQIPFQWWVPAYCKGADHGSDNSLLDTVQAQLDVGAEFLYLPKFLMVLYQMTL